MTGYSLGRVVDHDPLSRAYAFPEGKATSADIIWKRLSPILDQGAIGCCTGAAMAGWLGCEQNSIDETQAKKYDIEFAHKLYSLATRLDPFPGVWEPDDTGSSGNAVAKAARNLKEIKAYRWAFSTSALLSALNSGPIIMGIPWYEAMFSPDKDYKLWPYGNMVGGHEVLIRGIIGRNLILSNSWGKNWGQRGEALLPLDAWDSLRKQQADVTIPISNRT